MKRSVIALAMAGAFFWGGALCHAEFAMTNFFNFENNPVHPVALSPDATRLAVCNLPDDRLEISGTIDFPTQTGDGIAHDFFSGAAVAVPSISCDAGVKCDSMFCVLCASVGCPVVAAVASPLAPGAYSVTGPA